MTDREVKKFMLQIESHWGDPLYANTQVNSGTALTKETWEYVNSRSKSIGILLKMTSSDGLCESPFCLVVYSSGKSMNTLNSSQIVLDEFIKLFMSNPMVNKLNIFPLNYGKIIFLDELLYLVERGSLILFSWSQSQLKWIQTPILYLFNTLIKNRDLFKLNNYISYSRMKRSGYKFRTSSNRNNIKLHETMISGKSALSHIDIEEYGNCGTNVKRIKALSSINSNSEIYLIKNLKGSSKEDEDYQLLFISRQPYECFLIRSSITKANNDFIVSVVSINSEIRLKASIYKFH
ncbi:uncharacterized protein cubi_03016x5 [Cryptosporidium ubiquitum]|uniref:Uncharacterized protein n=1 Tax=Cryptosporidium ubiquitum TaxID=857276 RepID=A0A1J4MPT4_9CRYT|nr:uncharacterized protein cubi_03016x5 [Cryptosporidium ubiquitum]OII74885.1 hypothetical protein cubi_03016x5 [Cryptosporidium ubiquitum]